MKKVILLLGFVNACEQLDIYRDSHQYVQRLCQSGANAEIGEILAGIRRRFDELGIPFPDMIVVDNCCHVRGEIRKSFPDIAVVLDVYHFLMR
jgi:hypothetical protein